MPAGEEDPRQKTKTRTETANERLQGKQQMGFNGQNMRFLSVEVGISEKTWSLVSPRTVDNWMRRVSPGVTPLEPRFGQSEHIRLELRLEPVYIRRRFFVRNSISSRHSRRQLLMTSSSEDSENNNDTKKSTVV